MNIHPVAQSTPASFNPAIATAPSKGDDGKAPQTFKGVTDAIDLTRLKRDDKEIASALDNGRDAIVNAINQFSADLNSALNDISWLLTALGMEKAALPAANEEVGKAVRNYLDEHSQGPTVRIEQSQSIYMEMRELSITVSNGNHVTQVSMSSMTFVATSSTSVSVGGGYFNPSAAPEKEAQAVIDPVVLDLSGNGINLTPPETGKTFDLNGDGQLERTAWVQGDDALLAMDRNKDGVINSGQELFGEANGGANGFEELARLDENHDGAIDAQDSGFSSLLLLREGGRLDTLESQGITRIRLDLIRPISQQAGEGGRLVAASMFERADGAAGMVADGLFNVLT